MLLRRLKALKLGKYSSISYQNNILAKSLSSATEAREEAKVVPEEAHTVIVGGGVVGCSIAYHLAKKLNKSGKVILLEKTDLTAGSTWHAAGLTTSYHTVISLKRLHWESLNFFAHIAKETGMDCGYHPTGSIRLATSPVRMDEIKYMMSHQGWNDAPSALLTPEQIQKMVPIMDVEGANVLGGLLTANDGYIDPYSLTQAIAVGARKYGAGIHQHTEVTGLKLRPDHRWEVTTPQGSIIADRVVNASGFWARQVAELHDQFLPLIAVEHQYTITKTVKEVETLPKEFPVLRHLDGSFYLRQERQGLLIGPYESPETMKLCSQWAVRGVPKDFGRELFQPDLDRLQPHLDSAMQLMPSLQTAEIQTTVNGPITYTPDVLPMVGPTNVPNMWVVVGFGYGIIHSGGVGKYIANWITNGEPDYDMIELDPERFQKWANADFADAKIRESYGLNNSVPYPFEDRRAGRPTSRVSTVHDQLIKAGAFMGFHSGWETPEWFAPNGSSPEYKPSFYKTNWHEAVKREHETVMSSVGLIDLSPFAKFMIEGDDAFDFLNTLVSGRVPKAKGRTSLVHALTPKARVYSELTVTRMDEAGKSFFAVTGGSVEGHDLRHINELIRTGSWNVRLRNASEELTSFGIAGPKSSELMAKVTGQDMESWKFLECREVKINSVSVFAIRISYTGELGYEIYAPNPGAKAVYQDLIERGQVLDIGHFGTHTLNTMRLEKGFKLWGSEMNLDVDPIQADLQNFIDWKKQVNFVGKDELMKKRLEVPQTKLVMLEIEDSDAFPEGNETVWVENKIIGNTTSGCFSPAISKGLAFAYVPTMLSYPGTEMKVELMGERREAKVLKEPPVLTQPERQKLKS